VRETVAVTVVVSALFDVCTPSTDAASALPPPPAGPPQPASFFSCYLALSGPDALPQLGSSLVFGGPVFVPVNLPLLSEVGRERLRKQEQLDVVASRRNVFFGVFLAVFRYAMAGSAAVQGVLVFLRNVDEVV